MKNSILGISRASQFSPNSQDRDAAIFAAVTSRLERMGHKVDILSEDLVPITDLTDYDLVFSMARGRNVLAILSTAEKNGLTVINSPTRLLLLSRDKIIELLDANNIPLPKIFLYRTSSINFDDSNALSFPFWMKRIDACAQQRGDVILVHNTKEYKQAVENFRQKGVSQFIAEEHIEGDLVKFYGVEGTPFFNYTYPTIKTGFSKFGLEDANGAPSHYAFDVNAFKETMDKAALATGVTVYGGDAVIKENGQFCIIDFNDWPSFASCRRDAAKHIAYRISHYKEED